MCGILGSVNVPFNNSDLDTIKHRGPDDFGIEECSINGYPVLFAHRRLSIIDLTLAGHQPMYTECGSFVIIFNGEIYNHQELREKLPDSIKYKGHSDTETILYYFKEFGVSGIKDFNGIFSIAILDRVKMKLYLIRDPFGVKPLYYHSNGFDKLIFSSEIRPIRTLLTQTELDPEALATLLRLRFIPSPDTLENEIQKIRPGHYLEIDFNADLLTFTHHSYIRQLYKTIKPPLSEILTAYGQKVEEAVTRQLISDVEVGVLLSGGIDSAVIAAIAQKHYKGKLKAFTIGFEGDFSEDEISDAADTAKILGLQHFYKRISFADFLKNIEECSRIVEEPLASTSMVPMYFLSELASEHVKVVLTGQGADETLGGYTRYKSELILNRTPRILQKFVFSALRTCNFRNEKLQRGIKCLELSNPADRFLSSYEIFSIREIQRLISIDDRLSSERINFLFNLLNCKNSGHPVESMMALDARLNLADDLLNYTDKITMNFSIECRVPMLDLELVKFIESLPYDLKLNIWGGKLIHKRYAKSILPERIINRKKKGFDSPTNKWFNNNSDTIKDVLLAGGSSFSKVFNQQFVNEIITMHQHGFNKEKQIFLLLSIYYWLEGRDPEKVSCSKYSNYLRSCPPRL